MPLTDQPGNSAFALHADAQQLISGATGRLSVGSLLGGFGGSSPSFRPNADLTDPLQGREFELQMVDTLNRVESIMANVQCMINRQSVESKALLCKENQPRPQHGSFGTSPPLSRGSSFSGHSVVGDHTGSGSDAAQLAAVARQQEATIAELRNQIQRLQQAQSQGQGQAEPCNHGPQVAALQAEVKDLQAALKQLDAEWSARSLADKSVAVETEQALKAQVKSLQHELHKAKERTADEIELARQVDEARGEAEELRLQLDELRQRYEQELLEVREQACRDREEALANEARSREERLQAEREELQKELERLDQEKQEAIRRHEQIAVEREQVYSAEKQMLDLQLEELQSLIKGKEAAIQSKDERLTAMESEYENTLQKYQTEVKERRRIFNMLQEVRGNIRVFCRVRPLLAAELAERPPVPYNPTFPEEHAIVLHESKEGATSSYIKAHQFEFDRVFSDRHSQQDVFAEVAPLVTSVMDGFNVCIFAYGQTGSGKTYTMEGVAPDFGINQRTLDELFHVAHERQPSWEYRVAVSVLEIYNESVYDLLSQDRDPRERKIEIRMTKHGIALPDATTVVVNDSQSVLKVLGQGQRNRSVGQTDMNEHSSRSHCILSVHVEGINRMAGQEVRGKLHLVDLAGSEKLAKSKATGDRLTESLHINKSLSALGDVIAALSKKEKHVPFRNSSLTFLLQDSLGGDSKTLMFVNISPSMLSVSESINSLNFASRVQKVELGKAKKHIKKLEE